MREEERYCEKGTVNMKEGKKKDRRLIKS